MTLIRKVLSRYEVYLTCTEKFDSSENTGYTTYGILVKDSGNQGEIQFRHNDVHTDKETVRNFINRMQSCDELGEQLAEYLDGCDDVEPADSLHCV